VFAAPFEEVTVGLNVGCSYEMGFFKMPPTIPMHKSGSCLGLCS